MSAPATRKPQFRIQLPISQSLATTPLKSWSSNGPFTDSASRDQLIAKDAGSDTCFCRTEDAMLALQIPSHALTPPDESPATPSDDALDLKRLSLLPRAVVDTTSCSTGPTSAPGCGGGRLGSSASAILIDRAASVDHLDRAAATGLSAAIAASAKVICPFNASSSSCMRIVCQTVPCPLTEFTADTPAAISHLVPALHISSKTFLHIQHVVPNPVIPASPPVTPSDSIDDAGAGDYFAVNRVMHGAACLPNRHPYLGDKLSAKPQAAPSRATAPASAHLILYERYFPPATSQEFQALFDSNQASSLVDRFAELAPGGFLVFIYPTQKGANTFVSTCLRPVLDPVLRQLMVQTGLPANMIQFLSSMPGAKDLLGFEGLRSALQQLLSQLSAPTTAVPESEASNSPRLELVHSSTAAITLRRHDWEHWWTEQEMPRLHAVLQAHGRQGRANSVPGLLPSSSGSTTPGADSEHTTSAASWGMSGTSPTAIARSLVESMRKRGYAPGEARGESDDIEVGIFVVNRHS